MRKVYIDHHGECFEALGLWDILHEGTVYADSGKYSILNVQRNPKFSGENYTLYRSIPDILRAHRAEVTEMLLKEYDEEFHISCEKKISYEDGYEDGVKQEKARADDADRRAEEAIRKVEILTHKLRGCSDEEIAAALNVSIDVVRECIAGAERED